MFPLGGHVVLFHSGCWSAITCPGDAAKPVTLKEFLLGNFALNRHYFHPMRDEEPHAIFTILPRISEQLPTCFWQCSIFSVQNYENPVIPLPIFQGCHNSHPFFSPPAADIPQQLLPLHSLLLNSHQFPSFCHCCCRCWSTFLFCPTLPPTWLALISIARTLLHTFTVAFPPPPPFTHWLPLGHYCKF